jgi:lytic murein transglycosylase
LIPTTRTWPAYVVLAACGLASLEARSQAPDEFGACVAGLRSQAPAQGIKAEVFDDALHGVEADPDVIESMDRQPEFGMAAWEYLALLVDDKRIFMGRRKLEEWATVLRAIERTFDVERHVVVAIWGVESNYGKNLGQRPLVRSLATASCFGRRQAYFRDEFFQVLRIRQDGDIRPEDLTGSWAGAFGQTQFMPSTFKRLAVDFDGDGRRDLVNSIPDALASTANYLRNAGWKRGAAWGFEVRLPRKYDGPSGRRTRKSLAEWHDLGIRRVDGKRVGGDESAALLLPAGARGPAFLVLDNFQALYSYNASESYALAIAHLADRLHGRGPFKASWPTDDPVLTRSQRLELQSALAALGYDVGEADGIIGSRTVEAVKHFQRSAGMQPDGYASLRLLDAVLATPLN